MKKKFQAQYKITNTFTVIESAESMADFTARFNEITDVGYTSCVASSEPVIEWVRVVDPATESELWNKVEDAKVNAIMADPAKMQELDTLMTDLKGALAPGDKTEPLPKPLFPMNQASDTVLNSLVADWMEDIFSDAGKRLLASMGPDTGKTSKS